MLCSYGWKICSPNNDHNIVRNEGKWEVDCQKAVDVSNNSNVKFSRIDLQNSYQLLGHQAILITGTMSSFFLLRLMQLDFLNTLTKMFQGLFPRLFQTLAARSLPLACISSSLNKPTPLNLDLSLPSVLDIRWNFSRLLYLFNIQMEKNIATFLVDLLVA
ncbi:putative ion channel POLLUX-like 2 [Hibiscus syriacus]|uniref:putative ion channel POLLUX-like 2 n=1 Tax=Hibiscus syriacus TaxID=106335 RepID=UPI0019212902|nr:putative ion channel POLLUX-like 2 [Hibiscus syriacus]